MKGPYVAMKVVGENEVPKEEVEWNDEDLEKIKINNKINKLQCALNPIEFNRASGCDTAKEMWDMLEEAKKATIEEAKNLNTLKLDDLIGNLMTYEIDIQVDGKVEVVEKKKNVVFKDSKQKEESEDDASDDESSNERDITKLASKEVKKYMKKSFKGKSSRRNKEIHYSRGRICSNDDDKGKPSEKHIICYKCNKMGHDRNECPQLKKGERKDKKGMNKKAFAATWSDDETSSTKSENSLENGVANLYFMAQEDSNNDEEVNSNFSSLINENSFEYTYDDLCKVLDCSINDIKRLRNENLALTKYISLPNDELEFLSKQNEVLVKENASLNVKITSLKHQESKNALKKGK
ncbi:hypothetical protein SLEP1_g26060 [Rubroshorea leprosula]|uniref:CCHC-type domain-containing protein n=1 Tax=Rubroshorea leprosula TaxID=152421 RepID=A0AAV5JKK5_9ROSI|nr:hypothetical protein SLEP1_g26060 [Rubroshorea leprosula]